MEEEDSVGMEEEDSVGMEEVGKEVEILNISETKISIPILSSKKRILVIGTLVLYSLNVTSTRTPESYRLILIESISTGEFDTLLRTKSGIQLLSTADFTLDNFSPTSRPSMRISLYDSGVLVLVTLRL